jgi:hypothetical protein
MLRRVLAFSQPILYQYEKYMTSIFRIIEIIFSHNCSNIDVKSIRKHKELSQWYGAASLE